MSSVFMLQEVFFEFLSLLVNFQKITLGRDLRPCSAIAMLFINNIAFCSFCNSSTIAVSRSPSLVLLLFCSTSGFASTSAFALLAGAKTINRLAFAKLHSFVCQWQVVTIKRFYRFSLVDCRAEQDARIDVRFALPVPNACCVTKFVCQLGAVRLARGN